MLKKTNLKNTMKTNQQVVGTYCGGHKFSGTIVAMRAVTVKTDGAFEFTVKLDRPMKVYGWERDTLCMHAKFDGTPSSYSGFKDAMVPA